MEGMSGGWNNTYEVEYTPAISVQHYVNGTLVATIETSTPDGSFTHQGQPFTMIIYAAGTSLADARINFFEMWR